MYKKELENLINTKKLPKALFLYGACEYQINVYGKKIIQEWSENKDDILTFYFDEYDFSSVKKYLSQNSLFGDKNIAVIKTENLIAKKELDVLISICQKNDNSFLLLQCYKEDQKTPNMAKSFIKQSGFVRFFKLNLNEALGILSFEANNKNIDIQTYALSQLYLAEQENLALAVNELDKLSILQRQIGKNEIDKYVHGLGEISLDATISKLIDKKDTKKEFKSILESGNYTHMEIISALQRYISQLYLFHLYIKAFGSLDIKAILGYYLPPDMTATRSSQCMRLDFKTYRLLFECLSEWEFDLKTQNNLDKDAHFFSLILKLQSLLK